MGSLCSLELLRGSGEQCFPELCLGEGSGSALGDLRNQSLPISCSFHSVLPLLQQESLWVIFSLMVEFELPPKLPCGSLGLEVFPVLQGWVPGLFVCPTGVAGRVEGDLAAEGWAQLAGTRAPWAGSNPGEQLAEQLGERENSSKGVEMARWELS